MKPVRACFALSSLALSLVTLTACPGEGPIDDGDAGPVEDAGPEADAGPGDDAGPDAGPGDGGPDAGPGDDGGPGDGELANLVETAQAAGDFTTLLAALDTAGLTETLTGEGPFTVLAPTDEAAARLPEGTLEALEPATLTTILQHHVIDGSLPAATILESETLEPLAGGPIQVDVVDDGVVLNGTARVITADIEATNGILHAIDGVLLPADAVFPGDVTEALAAYPRFATLVAAAERAGLLDDLMGEGPYTVFAPSDEAFEAAGIDLDALSDEEVTALVSYHVVPEALLSTNAVPGSSVTTLGGAPIGLGVVETGLRLNSAVDVSYADFEAENGVLHVIDEVLTPPGDLTEVATEQARFSTLLGAVETAGLTDTLTGEGPFTLLAPTNESFAALPAGVIAGLEPDALGALLQNHVLDGILAWTDIAAAEELTPLAGGPIDVNVENGTPILNGTVRLFGSNVPAENGILHFLDGVLIPQDVTFPGDAVEALSAYARFSEIAAAVASAELVDDLSAAGPFTIFVPSNEALAAAGIDLETLPAQELTEILLNHVVAGEVLAADAVGSATTLQGGTLNIAPGEEGLVINGDTPITYADFEVENGVLHVIDGVLMPGG